MTDTDKTLEQQIEETAPKTVTLLDLDFHFQHARPSLLVTLQTDAGDRFQERDDHFEFYLAESGQTGTVYKSALSSFMKRGRVVEERPKYVPQERKPVTGPLALRRRTEDGESVN